MPNEPRRLAAQAMFLLAAKLACVLVSGELQADRLTDHERAVWTQYRPAIVTLYGNDQASGVAALIDVSGYFVTHSSSVTGPLVSGKDFAGHILQFSVVDKDKATQLVLLKTSQWQAGSAKPFKPPTNNESDGGGLLAVLPTGPIRAAFISKSRYGILKPSRRVVPLTEMRFEASSQQVGGALVFRENGELIGTINATLDRPDTFSGNFGQGGQGFGVQQNFGAGGGGQSNPGGGPNRITIQNSGQGPAEMTVAYSVGTEIIKHTLYGFLSPNHEAEYAALGIFCTDAIGGGAQIQKVTPGSPAAKSKLRPGDILMNIGFQEITDQVAFATAMLRQKVGEKITLVIKRGRASLLVDIVPVKAQD